jgi:hypothetical protein
MRIAAIYRSVWEEGVVETPCFIEMGSTNIVDIASSDEGQDYEHHVRDEVDMVIGQQTFTFADFDESRGHQVSLNVNDGELLRHAILALTNGAAETLYTRLNSGLNETGNFLFVGEESSRLAFYKRLDNSTLLAVEYLPENYPAMSVYLLNAGDHEFVAHVEKYHEGWLARKCNHDHIPICASNYVSFDIQ